MNTISGMGRGYNDYSSLFSGNSSRSGDIMNGISFSELNMIKVGAYKKLADNYYGNKQTLTHNKTEKEKAEHKAEVKSLSESKSIATSLKNAAAELKKENFADRESALKKVQSFVSAYNQTIKAADSTDNNSILRRTVGLTETTSSVRKLLKNAGISIEKDNTLKLDTERFKKADLSALKSVFNGNLSYSDRVAGTASAMVNIASNKINSLSGKLYNHTGSYYRSNYVTKIDKAV